jgi:hypothetical protein
MLGGRTAIDGHYARTEYVQQRASIVTIAGGPECDHITV